MYVIVEYAEHGNLRDFLRKHNANTYNDGYEKPNSDRLVISEKNLLSFTRQVSLLSIVPVAFEPVTFGSWTV